MGMTKRIFQAFAMVLCVCLAAGCSSDSPQPAGGEQSQDNGQGNMLTGVFLDSPVAGLRYITSSGLEGMTNTTGEFQYLLGDTLTFFLGALELGSFPGADKITPFDLVGFELAGESLSLSDVAQDIVEAELTNSATKFEEGVNMLILLQSLDRNNNPDDGIEIASSVFNFFTTAVTSLLFNVDTRDFLVEFLKLFFDLVTGGFLNREADDRPVDRDDALVHFLAGT